MESTGKRQVTGVPQAVLSWCLQLAHNKRAFGEDGRIELLAVPQKGRHKLRFGKRQRRACDWKVVSCVLIARCVWFFATPRTVARQAPFSYQGIKKYLKDTSKAWGIYRRHKVTVTPGKTGKKKTDGRKEHEVGEEYRFWCEQRIICMCSVGHKETKGTHL